MQHYLKVPIRSGLIKSPFRKDNNPTCGFYYSKKGRLYLHDFGTDEYFDVFEVVKRKYGLSFYKAMNKIIDEKDQFSTEIRSELDAPELEFIPGANNFSYFYTYGITDETLLKHGVSNARAIYVNESLTWRATEKNPIFVYSFPSGNFKLYRPLSVDKSKK